MKNSPTIKTREYKDRVYKLLEIIKVLQESQFFINKKVPSSFGPVMRSNTPRWKPDYSDSQTYFLTKNMDIRTDESGEWIYTCRAASDKNAYKKILSFIYTKYLNSFLC